MADLISLVVPCYNEEDSLSHFYEAFISLTNEMPTVDFELIFVNDGSKDNTLQILRNFARQDMRVHYYSFSRNFGKEAAMLAGFEKSHGNYIAILDADLQDPPQLIVEMYPLLKTGQYDCVATRRNTRKGEPPIRSFFADQFYKLFNTISDTEIVNGARDFRLMTRQMLNAILEMQEYNRFSKGIFSFVGFNTKWIAYENVERVAGNTSWSFWSLFKYSLEGVFSFSVVPLHLASLFGVLMCCVSFVYIAYIVIKTLLFGDPVDGFPTLICVITFIGGIQLFTVGILGQYLARMYLETKGRPKYIIKEESHHNAPQNNPL